MDGGRGGWGEWRVWERGGERFVEGKESKHPLQVYPDSKPVHQAIDIIKAGGVSASSRMSSFLANVNQIPIISKHISGKAKLNEVAHLQSRAISSCQADHCSIHKFVNQTIEGVRDADFVFVGQFPMT